MDFDKYNIGFGITGSIFLYICKGEKSGGTSL